jgi:hypothetical protein
VDEGTLGDLCARHENPDLEEVFVKLVSGEAAA